MRDPISVEPEHFDAASKVFGDKVYTQLYAACGKLEGSLGSSGTMAGNDPAGVQWAGDYDQAARDVHAVLIDLQTACLKIAVMLQQTGFNHGMAESASDPTKSTPTPPDPSVYIPNKRSVPDLPSASGGSTDPPAGWWLIEHTVGYLWPNGEPNRLRAAATCWNNCADAVQGAAQYIPEAVEGVLAQKSPEVHDALTVCDSMSTHIEDIAASCRDLAKACTDFAAGVDKAHKDITDELVSLLEWTAGIEAGGLAVGIFTAGIGEGAAQAAEATRVAVTAGRVGKIIETVIELAGALARSIGSMFTKVSKVAQRLLRIERAEVSEATVTAASRTAEDAADAETAAVTGLETAEIGAERSAASVAKKLNDYLLNPDHAVGASKAKWFEQALGFTRENQAKLASQIVFDPAKAVETAVTQYGTKYNQVIGIIGANGRMIDVTFAWIRNNDGVVRLVTAIPTKG